ncbi:hypothetical protein [Burkholderia cenocepacia]|uniref:hypothetical protein n=1 Tax=Burkholderia cenocepacia TaxID=95486 RepID=UPI000F5AE027|nr:hypothetical protein [Burkholderia cenocepacia]
MKTSQHLLRYLVAICTTSLLYGCGGDNDAGDRLGIARPSLRFVDAMSTMSLDVYRNGKRINLPHQHYEMLSKLLNFPDGLATFSVRDAAHPEYGDMGIVADQGSRGHRYLLNVFNGNLPAGTLGSAQLELIDDPYDRRTSITPTLRIVNAAANTAAVEIEIIDLERTDSPPSATTSLPYKATWPESGSNSLKLKHASYRIRVTAVNDPSVVLFDSGRLIAAPNADLVAVLLPTRIMAGPISRGDLKVRIDDGNSNEPTRDIIDHPGKST